MLGKVGLVATVRRSLQNRPNLQKLSFLRPWIRHTSLKNPGGSSSASSKHERIFAAIAFALVAKASALALRRDRMHYMILASGGRIRAAGEHTVLEELGRLSSAQYGNFSFPSSSLHH